MTRVQDAGDRYRLVRRVGSGGIGTVYQAADLLLGRTVAIKCLHDEQSPSLLHVEARALAEIRHTRVVALHDVVLLDGRLSLVMEYVDGCNLEEWIQANGPPGVDQSLRLFRQIVQGVLAGHAAGVLHCDLKPSNVLLAQSGEVKLGDFTLAHQMCNGAFRGQVGGSAAFAAPEQLVGEGIGAWTDVYGLGVLLRRLLLESGNSQLEEIVRRATAPDPKDRFQTVDELSDALPPDAEDVTQVTAPSRVGALTRVAPRENVVRVNRARALLPLGGLAALMLLLTALLGTRLSVFASPPRTALPDLVATQSGSAQLVLRSLVLHAYERRVYSTGVPAGVVISQRPAPGSAVNRNSVVTLIVSRGPQPVVIPEVRGMVQEVAWMRLQHIGMHIVVRHQDSISHPDKLVVSQTPLPGSMRVPGSAVTITISHKPWWWIF